MSLRANEDPDLDDELHQRWMVFPKVPQSVADGIEIGGILGNVTKQLFHHMLQRHNVGKT